MEPLVASTTEYLEREIRERRRSLKRKFRELDRISETLADWYDESSSTSDQAANFLEAAGAMGPLFLTLLDDAAALTALEGIPHAG